MFLLNLATLGWAQTQLVGANSRVLIHLLKCLEHVKNSVWPILDRQLIVEGENQVSTDCNTSTMRPVCVCVCPVLTLCSGVFNNSCIFSQYCVLQQCAQPEVASNRLGGGIRCEVVCKIVQSVTTLVLSRIGVGARCKFLNSGVSSLWPIPL